MIKFMLGIPKRFPVETALGIVFYINSIYCLYSGSKNGDILLLYLPLQALTFWLRRVNMAAYLSSFFLFVPLLVFDIKPFLWSSGFFFMYLLAWMLLLVGNRKLDNHSFVEHAAHVISRMFVAMSVMGILSLAVVLIISSFIYIFEIKNDLDAYRYVLLFIWIVLAPLTGFALISKDKPHVSDDNLVTKVVLNYILTPAVIVYTAILYLYFIKIVIEWELPKGGVAWMVIGFITSAIVGSMSQTLLNSRYYDWFYNRFTFIAVPPLVLYWVGLVHRICMYSLTESRFYLIVVGVLMTCFVLMLLSERTRHYQLMTICTGTAIILFTYIPGISAKSIGLYCQKQRLEKLVIELDLKDVENGDLKDNKKIEAIRRDSLLNRKYKEYWNVKRYVEQN